MKLKWVHIKNYRSCKDIQIEIGPMHALVGANNAGKSSIIRALDFLFNPSKTKIDKETFWNGNTELEIRIEAIFGDISDAEIKHNELNPYLKLDNTFHIARTVIWNSKEGDESDGARQNGGEPMISQQYCKPVPKIEWLNEKEINGAKITEWWKEKDTFLTFNNISFLDYVGTAKPSVGEWKEAAAKFAAENLSTNDYEEDWVENPRGYAGVLKGTLPNFIFIPAVRDVTDEAKVTKSNPFGRLLYAVLAKVTTQQMADLESKLEELQKRLNRTGGVDRLQSIVDTEKRLNDVLKDYMKDCDLEIEFQAPSVENLLTSPQLFANDGFRNMVSNKGHGLQRAIIFSILRCYSELITSYGENVKRPMIFAVEEPELYMHPQLQRTIRRVFRRLSIQGDQVLFTTHSALLVDVAFFDEIIRVEAVQEQAESRKTVKSKIYHLKVDSLIEDLKSRHGIDATEDSIRERYSHVYHPNRSEGFFAKRIILVEGATEQYALPIYAEAGGQALDSLNISVVDSGGKSSMDRLYRVFNELGIPCFMLFDYDKNNQDINTSEELLKLVGESPNPPDTLFIGNNVACFPNNWEEDLDPEIPGIDQLRSKAKQDLGEIGKPLLARYIANKLTSQTPAFIPPSIVSILERAVSVECQTSCLCKITT